MPHQIDTRILYTVEHMIFAIDAWFVCGSLDGVRQMVHEEFGFEVPNSTLESWIADYQLWLMT